jgi:hypothetical protein
LEPENLFLQEPHVTDTSYDEIVKLGKKKSLPLFDQLALLGSDRPTIYEAVSEINAEIRDEEDEIHQMGTHQDPEWLQDILQGQQDSTNNIVAGRYRLLPFGQYGDNRVRPALLSCLRNARSKQWYTSLSDTDKASLGENCENWKTLLRRDFDFWDPTLQGTYSRTTRDLFLLPKPSDFVILLYQAR